MLDRLLVALPLAFAASAPLFAETAPLAPFQAEYQVLRNGKELGHATLALRPAGDGTWEFSERTAGTKGMASLLGVDIVETSTFRWRDGLPQGLQYSYSQQAAIKSKQRSTDFDWRAHEAHTRDGQRDWTAPLDRTAMDRNLVTLALMASLKNGAGELSFAVVDKDRVAEQRYVAGARESLSLPAGNVDAVRVERRRDDSRRTTTSWFAPQRDWLPVQIEQQEKGDTITMRLLPAR
jgi:hypothetical protein